MSPAASSKHLADVHVFQLGLPDGVAARQCHVVVEPDSIIMELSNPELEQQAVEGRLQFESGAGQLLNRQAE